MNKIQISQLNAARSTGVVIERHKDSLPEAAQEAHAEAIELIEKIVETGQQQKSTRGLAAEKEQAKNALADSAAAVAGALCSYGHAESDDRLVAACDYSRSSVLAPPEAEIVSRCIGLHTEATALVDKLGKFKVTATTLKAFKAQIEAFVAVQTSPRDGIAQSAAATKRLRKLVPKLRQLQAKRLDPLIAPFKETNPELWSEYRSARKLVNGPTATSEPDVTIVATVAGSTEKAKAA